MTPAPRHPAGAFPKGTLMQLITPFLALLQGGVVLTLRLSATAGGNIQLAILPHGKDSATGVALPPRALVGTAQELDDNLEAYLQKYAASVARVADIVAGADAELQAIEQAASAQARKAVADRGRSKASARAGGGAQPGPPTGNDDQESEDEAPLLSTRCGTPASGAASDSVPAAPGDGMSQELFVS